MKLNVRGDLHRLIVCRDQLHLADGLLDVRSDLHGPTPVLVSDGIFLGWTQSANKHLTLATKPLCSLLSTADTISRPTTLNKEDLELPQARKKTGPSFPSYLIKA